jgi:multicomponent Na+:H+ antiporter subunit F
MTTFYLIIAFTLLLSLVAGLPRVLRGPSRTDRMIAAQLFGTTGVAILLVLAEVSERTGVRDVALVFALLALVNVMAFAYHAPGGQDPE